MMLRRYDFSAYINSSYWRTLIRLRERVWKGDREGEKGVR